MSNSRFAVDLPKSTEKISYQTMYSHQIYLNSSLADISINGSMKSNLVFFFKNVLDLNKNTIETRFSVVNTEIPVSWYLINSSNNSITITVNGSTNTYLFPVGNYNVNTFINQWIATFGSTWAITYNKYKNLFQFSNSLGSFTLGDTGTNSLLPIIGFSAGQSYTSSGNVLNSIFPFNFSGLTRINIKSSTFNLRNVDSNNRGKTRTLVSVPVNANSNGIIYYNNYSHFKTIINNKHLQSINIEIQDDYKNYIDFNNIDWTITLQVDVINEVEETLDTLEDIYKIYQEPF